METEAVLLMDAPGYNSTLPYRLALYHAVNAGKLKETVDEKGKGKVPRTRLIKRPIEGADCREGAGEKGKTSGLAPPEPPIQLSGPPASTFQEYENPSFPYSMKDDANDASFPIQLVAEVRFNIAKEPIMEKSCDEVGALSSAQLSEVELACHTMEYFKDSKPVLIISERHLGSWVMAFN
ncbi:hypothetical protein AAF712_008545 [Marasmius tenuissimus]|uniref:Uncharacterized protein n=1 Tax=Marasmius tenuissimus TaxID=585030 RepID=A0ABR2ZUP0_9AGAR